MHDSSLALATRLFMAMACCRHCYCYYLQYGAAASPLLSSPSFLFRFGRFPPFLSLFRLCCFAAFVQGSTTRPTPIGGFIASSAAAGGISLGLPPPLCSLLVRLRARFLLFRSQSPLATTSILRLLPRSPTPDPEALTTAAAPADICLPGRRRGERLRCWIRVYLPPHYLPLLLEPAWLVLTWAFAALLAVATSPRSSSPLLCSQGRFLCPD